MYIIVYNAESDFIQAFDKDVEKEITSLIQEGYASEDIILYKAEEVSFSVGIKDISIVLDGS